MNNIVESFEKKLDPKNFLKKIRFKYKNILLKSKFYFQRKIGNQNFSEKSMYGDHVKNIFIEIYKKNYWGNEESRSGNGSDLSQTEVVRRELPILIKEFELKSMLDLPCGDFNWMKMLKINADYIGADIVPEMIEQNKKLYENEKCKFLTLDIIKDIPPTVDLIFCRDLMVHLSIQDLKSALRNIANSGSKYLLATTFTNRDVNLDIPTGYWRPLNLQLEPFNFPEPLKLINENCTEDNGNWTDKCLGLWRIKEILRKIS